jgi:hypothetical protein
MAIKHHTAGSDGVRATRAFVIATGAFAAVAIPTVAPSRRAPHPPVRALA